MWNQRYWAKTAASAALAFPLLALAGSDELTALRGLEPGMWELRDTKDQTRRTLCVPNGDRLIQLRHANLRCARQVVENLPTTATVQYSCTGAGYGRTTVNQITPRSVHIETQGVDAGSPFHFELEGRRVGTCR